MSQAPNKQNSIWNKTKVIGKKNFDKAWDALDKLGPPVNRLTNKLGSEAFWPMTIDKESEKVARILQSFCKDGVYAEESKESTPALETKGAKQPIDKPRGKPKVLQKIPSEVIRQAKGLAIFTAMRTGLWFSGAGGSGVLVSRVPETGEWSAPSGILLHTAGLGFLVGADIYDCVMVINTYEALEAFTKVRVTLGSEISVAAGPVGLGGVVESEVHKRRAPIWTYVKSRGFYAGVQIDGTVVIERIDENERFYGRKIPAKEILNGHARTDNPSVKMLTHTIRAAQGDVQFEQTPSGVNMVTGPSPSDLQYEDLAGTQMAQVQPPPDHGPQYNTGLQYNAQPPYNVEPQHNAGPPYNAELQNDPGLRSGESPNHGPQYNTGPHDNHGPQSNIPLNDPNAMVSCPICGNSVSSLKINDHIDSNCQSFIDKPTSSTGDLTSSHMAQVQPPPNHGPQSNAEPQHNAGPYNAGPPYNPGFQSNTGPQHHVGQPYNPGPPYNAGPQNNAGPQDNTGSPYSYPPQPNAGPYNAGAPYNAGPQSNAQPPYNSPPQHNTGPPYNTGPLPNAQPPYNAGPNAGPPYNPGPPHNAETQHSAGPPYNAQPQYNAGPYNAGPQDNPGSQPNAQPPYNAGPQHHAGPYNAGQSGPPTYY
ncbi:hypothetical protein BDV38DRAFT_267176 [Aspergillus pseudotamarii]|uniref:UBZ4-type domain-containing protein n=1 Tax=Aspergillus pseudotamarii TaxID=132259 RepID=A0A5N6TA68_ASPPS|nr:uncharacterized protein BDV38DRAFT_267176 [Aspergillus pseudotamarii]KAE8143157.1 hypothetical protein BDV38DRAFT_267176 [Aspergillus pseudotamarii]